VPEGAEALYLNADIVLHNLQALEPGPGDQPWCDLFAPEPCPLFYTPLVSLGEVVPIPGLEHAAHLVLYEYQCSIHPSMRGQLAVVPEE